MGTRARAHLSSHTVRPQGKHTLPTLGLPLPKAAPRAPRGPEGAYPGEESVLIPTASSTLLPLYKHIQMFKFLFWEQLA